MRFSSSLFLLLAPLVLAAEPLPTLEMVLRTPAGQMKYDVPSFDVRPGQPVRLKLENQDEMPHNLVLIKPCSDKGLALAQAAWALGEKGMEKAWVPEDPRVIVASKLIEAHGNGVIEFKAPEEMGDYPYVCTFPGHAMSMNGFMRVSKGGGGISDLTYQLYLGSWDKLPDFSALKPHRTGTLPEGKVGWKFDDYKNQFGLVFKGSLDAKQQGKYRFFLASDDGAQLLIDGKEIILHDGIHPANELQRNKVELAAGPHQVEVRYFQGGGEAELYLAWQGPGFSVTPLSQWIHPEAGERRKNETMSGIPLAPSEGRPVIYRNFIENVSPRAIAVGFQGGMNVCFDADQLNLGLFWRGAFMDAKRHWTDRGAGNQPPLGYDVVNPGGKTAGVALLADAAAPWPTTADRAAGPKFLGYRLDAKGFPTFRYQLGETTFSETYLPPSDATVAMASFQRVISISGTIAPGLHLRAAQGKVTASAAGHTIDDKFSLQVSGATPVARQDRELLIPITANTKLTLTYGWNY